MEFQIFAVKVRPAEQMDLFHVEDPAPAILRRVIESEPQVVLRKGNQWMIRGVRQVGSRSLHFKFGRTATTTLQVLEEQEFAETTIESAPHTHVFVELDLELVAIGKETKLHPDPVATAKILQKVLNASPRAEVERVEFTIDALWDPGNLLDALHSAVQISSFWVKIERPNSFDEAEDFIEPLQRYMHTAGADTSQATLRGDLDPEALEPLARRAAAYGSQAGARVRYERGGKARAASNKRMPIMSKLELVDDLDARLGFIDHLRVLWREIRGRVG